MCKNKYILPFFFVVFKQRIEKRKREKGERERKKIRWVIADNKCPTSPPICKRPRH